MMRPRTGQAVLEHEILGEQAATFGRLAKDLHDALAALNTFDRRPSTAKMTAERRAALRAGLVDAAAYALWVFVVQRECSGLRLIDQALEDFAVPAEVRAKMGAVRPR
jgi:hypothetical protein